MSHDLAIIVPATASPLVVVKGEVLAKIDDLVATAAVMTVVDTESAQTAADYLRKATTLAKEIEEARNLAKAPALAMGRAIDAAVKGPAARLDEAKRDLSRKVGEYQAEQNRIAREAEATRQREIKRKQDEQRKREEEARKANLPPPVAAPVVPIAVVIPTPKVEGIRMRSSLVFEVTDTSKLPDDLIVRLPDNGKIRARFCQLWREGDPVPEVAGLKFNIDRKAVSS